ncbi:MAG TPA: DUF4082 domain-containing protein [Candidatus Saccharimonadales bacterium]|nr:DUF4082 domain-containing protein [Candidatus Saccharimonadales bacterium]
MAATLFTNQIPSSLDANSVEGQPGVTLGTVWTSDHEGVVRGVRFYLGNRHYDTVVLTGGIFDWDSGTLLAQQNYTVTVADQIGFVTIPLTAANQVLVQRNKRYIAAVWYPCDSSPDGKSHYTSTGNVFINGPIDNPPLHALQEDTILDRRNGLYNYGASIAYPNNHFNSSCYFIDVSFDYVSRMPVLNQTSGKYEQKVIKRRQSGQWLY